MATLCWQKWQRKVGNREQSAIFVGSHDERAWQRRRVQLWVIIMTDHLILIANRRREIEAEIARLQSSIDSLQAELPELDAAERVLSRLSGQGGSPAGAQAAPQAAAGPEPVATTAKPEGTPTVPQMIVEALKDAAAKGQDGLTPAEMTAYIAQRWWPNVKGVAVSPIAWRMWSHNKKLVKEGSLYKLPPEHTEAAGQLFQEEPAASEPTKSAMRPVEPEPGGGT